MKPEKGEYGLWYAGTVGYATKEEAQKHIDRGGKGTYEHEASVEAGKFESALAAEKTKTAIWLSLALIGVVAIVGGIISTSKVGSSDRKIAVEALTRCQQTILSTAKYGDAERPPYREPDIFSETAAYIWEKGAFHFKNGFGTKVPQSAECIASKDKIVFLKINDEVLIGR